MLIRETKDFIYKVLKNKTYHLAFIGMNNNEAQELNTICENIMSEGSADGYNDAYRIYRYELKLVWGTCKELNKNYSGRLDEPDDDFSYFKSN